MAIVPGDLKMIKKYGSAVSITLMGGADRATGGGGEDTFIFAGSAIGADTVTDYTTGVDALHLDSALWSGDLSAAEVVAMFADDSTGSTVFDFGNGNSVTLDGVSDASALVSDLVLI